MSIEQRSELSLGFESRWRSLRKDGELVPPRAAFDLLDFTEYLSVLVIAEINLQSRQMMIKLAGNEIRDFVGFELTGRDFLEFDRNPHAEPGWQHRQAYHDHPCGRYEILDIEFQGGIQVECALTVFPLRGSDTIRPIVILAEPRDQKATTYKKDRPLIAETVNFGAYLDLGAGVPPEL